MYHPRNNSTLWKGLFIVVAAVLLFFAGGAGMDALATSYHGDFPATFFAVIGAFFIRGLAIVIAIMGVVVIVRAL